MLSAVFAWEALQSFGVAEQLFITVFLVSDGHLYADLSRV